VPKKKTTKKAGARSKASKDSESKVVQVQLYLRPSQVGELDADTKIRQAEVRQLMGAQSRVSRSAHGGSIIANYIKVRAINPKLSYSEFWEAVTQALNKTKQRKGRQR
jgi:hypothetical protein